MWAVLLLKHWAMGLGVYIFCSALQMVQTTSGIFVNGSQNTLMTHWPHSHLALAFTICDWIS